MSLLGPSYLTSIPFKPQPMFSIFETLTNGTLPAMPTGMGVPTGGTKVKVFDNRDRRITSLLLMFAMTAVNNAQMLFDIIGFSQIGVTGLYLPARFFLGEAQAGNISVAATGEASSFLADNFPVKTLQGSNVQVIEPTDDVGGALMMVDIRGFDYAQIRIAQGSGTAAVKGQVYAGTN